MESHLVAIRAANKAGANYAGTFVVYDLPERDCAAAASNGEYSLANNGIANYKKYIDAIKALVVAYSDVKIILLIGKRWVIFPRVCNQGANETYRARFSCQLGHKHRRC